MDQQQQADATPAPEQTDAARAKASEQRGNHIEVILAILLGIAAVLTAWAAFQSGIMDGEMSAAYANGIAKSDQASQVYNDATAADVQDQAVFLSYVSASQADNPDLATYIHDTLMSAELQGAVDWWIEQPEETSPETPFVEENPNWTNSLLTDADSLDEESSTSFAKAASDNDVGDEFSLLTVVLALSLFLLGMGSLVRQQRIQIGAGVAGVLIQVGALIYLFQLGDPAGKIF